MVETCQIVLIKLRKKIDIFKSISDNHKSVEKKGKANQPDRTSQKI